VKTPVKTAAAVLVMLALPACGSGRDPLTYQERRQGDSVEVIADSVTILNLRVLPPTGELYEAGSDARVALTLVNEARTADALVSATSDAAGSVALVKDTAPVESIPLPALGTAEPGYSLVLRGLTKPLRTGQHVTVRLVFQNAPSVEELVPVSTPQEVRERAPANPEIGEPAHTGGGEGGHGSGDEGSSDDGGH
jgi:copper(I)-binding protein